MSSPNRNDPCPCGSGKKFKKCCMGKTSASLGFAVQAGRPPARDFNATNVAPPSQLLMQAVALHQAGRLEEARAIYRDLLSINPADSHALHYLGLIALQQGQYADAASLIERAIRADRLMPAFHCNLGNAYKALHQYELAAAAFREAVRLDPQFHVAYCNLGNTYLEQGNLDAARDSYQKALALRADFAEAHYGLGNVLLEQINLDQAAASYRKAIAFRPAYAEAYCNLGSALQKQGRLDEAVASFRQALAIRPDFANAYSNLLFCFAYHASLDPQDYLSTARNWEQACLSEQDRREALRRSFRRSPLAGRRLRVGYVSGDFRQHAVSYFVEQLFAQHDRSRIELFAYSTFAASDAVTERILSLAEHWIPVAGVSDMELRDRIEADGIDMLIDLSGHTDHNRMGVFARRAAPVQAHYLGFMASTGLSGMDYWIGDEILTPPAMDVHFSEQVWRLPRVWVSYKTVADAPAPDWRPAGDGSVWLGSFNNLGKLTPRTFALWARVLHALPEGRLLLKTKALADDGNRRRILETMAGHGIAPDRIELQRDTDWKDYMDQYNRLDLALDPVGGHGGGTTTCDALWMGIPVITLEGDRATSRFTASILSAIGHPEWIARSEAEYVDKVVALARDRNPDKTLRSVRRESMARSPLCDAENLAAMLEDAYVEMFERWMKKQDGRT